MACAKPHHPSVLQIQIKLWRSQLKLERGAGVERIAQERTPV
ncbi:MAG TPA: hypothetical protein V6C78_04445 [Crinalium sp.]